MSTQIRTYEDANLKWQYQWRISWKISQFVDRKKEYPDKIILSFMGETIAIFTPKWLQVYLPNNPNKEFKEQCIRVINRLTGMHLRVEGDSIIAYIGTSWIQITNSTMRSGWVAYYSKSCVPYGVGEPVKVKATRIVSANGKKVVVGKWAIAKRRYRVNLYHEGEVTTAIDYTLDKKLFHYACSSYDMKRGGRIVCQCGEEAPDDIKVTVELIDKMEV